MTVIVMATLNEADNIGALLAALIDYPVIMIDAESTDGTAAIARHYDHVCVYSRPNRGIAAAYEYGLRAALAAGADRIVQMDAGGTHDPDDIARLLACDADLVIGSRFVNEHGWYGYRTAISHTATWLMHRRGVNVQDATSGFRVWRRDLLSQALAEPLRSRGFAFQLELLLRANALGAIIEESPIKYQLTNSSFRWPMLAEALKIVWMA